LKALVLTPTPTHPDNAGNRKGVLQLCNTFQELGYDLDCVYFPFENFDEKAMSDYFDGRLFVADRKLLYSNKPRWSYYKKRLKEKLSKRASSLFLKEEERNAESLCNNSLIDEHVPVYLLHWFKKNIKVHEYSLVLCEYVWMSAFLNFFPESVFKIIDTHDVFSNRYQLFKKLSANPGWVSLFPSQEAKGLKRANLLIAVNDDERAYFEKLSGVKCVQFGFSPDLQLLPKHEFDYRLLYFASSNSLNQISINWFLKEVFPLITAKQPQTKLLIGGRICSVLQTNDPRIEIKGEYENPAEFYKLGDIVINPESSGTGLKIKAIETFAFGLPLVATTAGAMGADKPFMNHFVMADSPDEFATAVLELFNSEAKRKKLVENAVQWLQTHKEKSKAALISNLPVPVNRV
jgi:polysaccharide biosynthesis protein PslH